MAHAPKPITPTLMPVRPSSRYCIRRKLYSVLEIDEDFVLVAVVHRSGRHIHDEGDSGQADAGPAAGSERVIVGRTERRDRADAYRREPAEVRPVSAAVPAMQDHALRVVV